MDYSLIVSTHRGLQVVIINVWSRSLSRHLTFKRWQGTWSSSIHWHALFFNACEIIFDRLVLAEVTAEAFLVKVRFKAENFLCDFLIFSLDPLQFSLSLVKVQALCFEFNVRY